MRAVAAAAILLLLAGCSSPTHESPSDALLSRYLQDDEPGCTAAVGVDGEVVWAGARGLADVASGDPLTTESIVDIASVSKQFTGVAILLLVQDGAISLDDALSLYVPGLGPDADRVTIAALLHHTSGIADYTSLLDADLSEPTTQEDAIAALAALPRLAGTAAFSYSNSNYVLLAEVVEAASGVPLPEFLDQRVFTPLSLDMRVDPLFSAPLVTTGHEGGEPVSTAWTQVGDGAVFTTPSELVRWADNYRTGELGGQELLDAQIAGAADTGYGGAYGAGIEVAGDGSLSHLGQWAGFVTVFGITADRHTAIAVTCNSVEADAGAIAEGLRELWA